MSTKVVRTSSSLPQNQLGKMSFYVPPPTTGERENKSSLIG